MRTLGRGTFFITVCIFVAFTPSRYPVASTCTYIIDSFVMIDRSQPIFVSHGTHCENGKNIIRMK